MAVADSATSNSMGIVNEAMGSFTSDNGIVTVTLGFVARWFRLINLTDVIIWEKHTEFAATHVLKHVGSTGVVTDDTNAGIVLNADGTVTITAATAGNAKAHYWLARG